MPLPLLVPAAVAASTEVSLLTLITSTTLALTGGFALGTEFSASPPIEHTESEISFGSFIAQLKAFPQQTKELMADVFSDFNKESKHIKDATDKLTTLSGRLEGVVQTTQKSVVQLQQHVHEPLIKVGQTLTITQRKTERVTTQLLAAQTELADATKKIETLAATLKKQQDSIVRLNAEISPLTSALALQTKEKEKAQKKLAALTLTYNQQQEGVKKTLQTQLTLNKGLTERLHQLELEVGRLEVIGNSKGRRIEFVQ
jgi:chromosome segregation ATPase